MPAATCAGCGSTFEAQRKTARFCGATCRKRAHRRPDPPDAVKPPSSRPSGLVDATRKELEGVGRLESMLGQAALRLAEQLEQGGDTGSATAALSKELRAVMGEALADAPKAADSLDELSARRNLKASSA